MKLGPTTREAFVKALELTHDPRDKFAKTFLRKGDMVGGWGEWTLGAFSESGHLMGACMLSVSKREPHVINLQLLHTFAMYRGFGIASKLMAWAVMYGCAVAKYFRVSSEPESIEFYKKIGFYFWGEQKSGCALSMFRYEADAKCAYDPHDPIISAALSSKRRGGVHQMYPTEFVTLSYEPYNRFQDVPCLSITV
jgi:GNAT superfamily N-acetyltransferase